MKSSFLKIVVFFVSLFCFGHIFSQDRAIIIWNNSEDMNLVCPIVISSDSITEGFANEHAKFLNRVPIGSKFMGNVILDPEKIIKIFEFLKLKYDIYQGSILLPNPMRTYPEIRYVVNDSIHTNLVLTNTEIFVMIINEMLEYSVSILSIQEQFELKKEIYILYNDMDSKHYEKE